MASKCLCMWGPCSLAMALLAGTPGAGVLAREANPSPPAKSQVSEEPQTRRPDQARRSTDRPPPESGRPFIGPRTTQGLAEDAIARSIGR